jgi:hypothetical protein
MRGGAPPLWRFADRGCAWAAAVTAVKDLGTGVDTGHASGQVCVLCRSTSCWDPLCLFRSYCHFSLPKKLPTCVISPRQHSLTH